MKSILEKAKNANQKTLSEYESKLLINQYGVEITKEELVFNADDAVKFAEKTGYPVVLKGVSHKITHKTEMGLVKLNLKDEKSVIEAFNAISNSGADTDGVLVSEMISGNREFVIGLVRDPNFGPCVMLGLGGIFTEIMKDVTFRVAPITRFDAEDMISELKSSRMLDEFRGAPSVNKEMLIDALIGIGNLGLENEEIKEIDINPLIIAGSRPVAVDALIVL